MKPRPDTELDLGFGFTAMACPCEIRIAGVEEAAARVLAQIGIDEVQRIEAKYSRYRADSIVSRLNAAAGSGRPVEVDAETAGLLDFAAQLHAASDGLFDLTSGVLRRAWDFRAGRLPTAAAVDALLPLVGWHRVRWPVDAEAAPRSIELPLAGMELDFGGIGKEYAADRAAVKLAERGVRSGLVNLGGDIRVIGPRPDGSPWQLGIAHPRRDDALIAEVPVTAGALATSGDAERFIEVDGLRYGHLLDPRSGWPVQHWQSVSVIAPTCLAAGALSTVAMLMGEGAPAWLEAQEVDHLAVDADGKACPSARWWRA